MLQSSTQPKKQDNRMSSGGGGWKWQGSGGLDKIWKKRVGNIGSLHKIGGLGTLYQLWMEGNWIMFTPYGFTKNLQ